MTKRRRKTRKVVWGAIVGIATVVGGALTWGKAVLDSFKTVREEASEPHAQIIKGSFQQSDFDQLVVRVSNPTAKTQSLSEPAIRCTTSAEVVHYIFVAPETPSLTPSPTFPAPSSFPLQVAAGGTVETTLFFRRLLGAKSSVGGLANCRKMRLSWLDADQKRLEGSEYSLGQNVVMFFALGAGA